jgi:hypothetical protein
LLPASSFGGGFFYVVHDSLLKSLENIYAALGGGWSRWQPLNVAVAKPYWQDASQRVLAGSNRNGGIQFRLDGNSPHLSAGGGNGRAFQFLMAMDSKLCYFHICFIVFSLFQIKND